jgi:hypothetical protein
LFDCVIFTLYNDLKPKKRYKQMENTNPTHPEQSHISPESVRRERYLIAAIVVTFTVVVLSATSFLQLSYLGSSVLAAVDADTYQAVTLVDGTRYFGRLGAGDDSFVALADPYSFKDGKTLIPRSSSAHNPLSPLLINKSQISTIENLSADSPVIKAITTHQAKQK